MYLKSKFNMLLHIVLTYVIIIIISNQISFRVLANFLSKLQLDSDVLDAVVSEVIPRQKILSTDNLRKVTT